MPNFIKKITVPGTLHSTPIEFAYPIDNHSKNVINILSGQNNTGKSFALENVRQMLQHRWTNIQPPTGHTKCNILKMGSDKKLHHGGVCLEMTLESPQPNILPFCRSSWRYMSSAGIIGLKQNPKQIPSNQVAYAKSFLIFAYQQLIGHVNISSHMPSIDNWQTDESVRHQMVNCLTPDTKLYKCKAYPELLNALEKILNGHLYLRFVRVGPDSIGQIELCLVYGDGSSRVYPEWSDGQRSVFYFLALINEIKPDILLLDEIENHLHPEYISEVLSFIKIHVAQSIITTHHPHVIFSEIVDRVIYIEVKRPEMPYAYSDQIDYIKKQQQGAPSRIFSTLENDFEKLTAIYKLFSFHDKHLLYQAQRVANDAEILFYGAILNLFKNGIAVASNRLLPDSQSNQLIRMLNRIGLLNNSNSNPSILDFGAGLGRTEKEVSKLSVWKLKGEIQWICWENDPETRNKLKQSLKSEDVNVNIPMSLDEISDNSVDVCTMINVIHHLTPKIFTNIIQIAISKIKPNGSILILELFPLLSAEKYAVPYTPGRVENIFRQLGLLASHEPVSMRDTTAYCLIVKPRKGSKFSGDSDNIQHTIEKEWEEILEDAIQRYEQIQAINDFSGMRDLSLSLTTIASIIAYKKGLWT